MWERGWKEHLNKLVTVVQSVEKSIDQALGAPVVETTQAQEVPKVPQTDVKQNQQKPAERQRPKTTKVAEPDVGAIDTVAAVDMSALVAKQDRQTAAVREGPKTVKIAEPEVAAIETAAVDAVVDDTSAAVVDTSAAVVDTSAAVVDTSAAVVKQDNETAAEHEPKTVETVEPDVARKDVVPVDTAAVDDNAAASDDNAADAADAAVVAVPAEVTISKAPESVTIDDSPIDVIAPAPASVSGSVSEALHEERVEEHKEPLSSHLYDLPQTVEVDTAPVEAVEAVDAAVADNADDAYDGLVVQEVPSVLKSAEPIAEPIKDTHLMVKTNTSAQHISSDSTDPDSPRLVEYVPNEVLEALERKNLDLDQTVQSLQRIIRERESQLERRVTDIISLQQQLTDVTQRLETSSEKEAAHHQMMTQFKTEFASRLAQEESKVHKLVQERDSLKKRLESSAEKDAVLEAKEEQIRLLMEEGESLSKKQAQFEATTRKLRAAVKEKDKEIATLQEQVRVTSEKLDLAVNRLSDQDQTEKRLSDYINKLQEEVRAAETRLVEYTKEAEAALDSERKVRLIKETDRTEWQQREDELSRTVQELHMALTQQQDLIHEREEKHLRELRASKERAEIAEQKAEHLSASLTSVTKPLLRQIEMLQQSSNQKQSTWETVERELLDRVRVAESKCQVAMDREKVASSKDKELRNKLEDALGQITVITAQRDQFASQLKSDQDSIASLRQENLKLREDVNNLTKSYESKLHESKESEKQLRRLLFEEKQKLEEREKEKEKDRMIKSQSNKDLMGSQDFVARAVQQSPRISESSRPLQTAATGMEAYGTPSSDSRRSSHDRTDLSSFGFDFSPLESSHVAATVQRLQTVVKQKEREIHSLLQQTTALEQSRSALADECVRLQSLESKYKQELKEIPHLRAQVDAGKKRLDAALELIGEKDEQVEELKTDLADVKAMFRRQIDELLVKIQKLEASQPS